MGNTNILTIALTVWLAVKGEAINAAAGSYPYTSFLAPRTSLFAFAPPSAVSHRLSRTTQQHKFLSSVFHPTHQRALQATHKTIAEVTAETPVTKETTKNKNPWKVHDAELLHRAYSKRHVPNSAYDKTTTNYDYLIVGSGIGGLWLAACLAKFNQTSLVLEQHYTAGGLQHEFTVKGYEFVPGLHYIANLPLVGPMCE